jgi:hypothetical protein
MSTSGIISLAGYLAALIRMRRNALLASDRVSADRPRC